MNSADIVRSLLWKEWRIQRAFWIAMLVLTIFLQLFYIIILEFSNALPVDQTLHASLTISAIMSALYMLGCGAMLFANERENNTLAFQQSLPVSSKRFFWTKLAFAVMAWLAFVFLVYLSAYLSNFWLTSREHSATHQMFDGRDYGSMILIGLAASFAALVWSVFFSLRLHSTLMAAILAMIAGSALPQLIAMAVYYRDYNYDSEKVYVGPVQLILVFLVCAASVYSGTHWLEERRRKMQSTPKKETLIDSILSMSRFSYFERRNLFRTLAWFDFRKTWPFRLVVFLLGLNSLVCICWLNQNRGNMELFWFIAALFNLYFLLPLVGMTSHKQTDGVVVQFLQDRGISPRWYWFYRHANNLLLPILLYVIYVVVSVIMFFQVGKIDSIWNSVGLYDIYESDKFFQLAFFFFAPGVLLFFAYAVGAFYWQFLKSPILAAVFACVTWLICLIYCILTFFFDLSCWWSVLPIPFLLLLATWFHADDWLLERKGWKAWRKPVFSLCGIVGIVLSTPLVFFFVPYINIERELGIASLERTPAQESLFIEYQQIRMTVIPDSDKHKKKTAEVMKWSPRSPLTEEGIAWLKENEATAKKLEELTARKETINQSNGLFYLGYHILDLLLSRAQWLESQGRLDEAWRSYEAAYNGARQILRDMPLSSPGSFYTDVAYWGGREDQSVERILKALRFVEQQTESIHPYRKTIIPSYLDIMRAMDGAISSEAKNNAVQNWNGGTQPKGLFSYLAFFYTRRVTQLAYQREIDDLDHLEAVIDAGKKINERKWQGESYRPPYMNTIPLFVGKDNVPFFLMRQHALTLILALEAWRCEHGDYPERLDQLVGVYLDKLPKNPFTGKDYEYFPIGYPRYLEIRTSIGSGSEMVRFPPYQPFLWTGLYGDYQFHSIAAGGGRIDIGLAFPFPAVEKKEK